MTAEMYAGLTEAQTLDSGTWTEDRLWPEAMGSGTADVYVYLRLADGPREDAAGIYRFRSPTYTQYVPTKQTYLVSFQPDVFRHYTFREWVRSLETEWTWDVALDLRSEQKTVSSTVYTEDLPPVDDEVEVLFRIAHEEAFEDGVQSEFEQQLVLLVRKRGSPAIDAISRIIRSEPERAEVTAVALRALGEIHHFDSYSRRLQLLETSLRSFSSWVRDGATLGLAWLDDPTAIPYLERAAEREPIEELRQDMQAVIDQLKETRPCRSCSGA